MRAARQLAQRRRTELGAAAVGACNCYRAGAHHHVSSLPSVMNAIVDALGGKHVDTPVTPERVWRVMNAPAPMLGLY